jgi:hypothetical protein
MEQNSKSADKSEALRDLSDARKQLESGNTRGASTSLYRAKVVLNSDEFQNVGADDLEKKLKDEQASNLIAAQNEFGERNGIVAGEINAAKEPAAQPAPLYDSAAAQDQWARLQQAQEISTAKIQPLHINLPVRGVHYAFTQVLQTEIGKPMTIELFAANAKAVNWPMRGLVAAGAFLLFWAAVAFVTRFTLSTARSRETIT